MNKLQDAVHRPTEGSWRLSVDRLHVVGPLDFARGDVPIEGAGFGGLQVVAILFQKLPVPRRYNFGVSPGRAQPVGKQGRSQSDQNERAQWNRFVRPGNLQGIPGIAEEVRTSKSAEGGGEQPRSSPSVGCRGKHREGKQKVRRSVPDRGRKQQP